MPVGREGEGEGEGDGEGVHFSGDYAKAIVYQVYKHSHTNGCNGESGGVILRLGEDRGKLINVSEEKGEVHGATQRGNPFVFRYNCHREGASWSSLRRERRNGLKYHPFTCIGKNVLLRVVKYISFHGN